MSDATPAAGQRTAAALAEAATAAGYAPSVHNTQPWRWRVQPDRLELFAERTRQLAATDPQGHLMLLSCGAALHHARVALAAEGWAAQVHRLPDSGEPDLLARIVVTGRIPVTTEAMRLVQAMQIRHTDRRPLSDEPLPVAAVDGIAAAAAGEGRLHVLTSGQVMSLATAAAQAAAVAEEDPEIREELAYWTSRGRAEGVGLPADVLLERAPQTTVPARDFGRPGTLPVGPGHDRAAVYALLYGEEDEPESWLRAGEALSAAWLTATELGASLVPLSGVIEVLVTRQALRGVLAGIGYPYLVLRLGTADPAHGGPPRTPRLPAAQVIDTSAVHPARP